MIEMVPLNLGRIEESAVKASHLECMNKREVGLDLFVILLHNGTYM
jgi:hypothetical protein